jgi:hypothetical protein
MVEAELPGLAQRCRDSVGAQGGEGVGDLGGGEGGGGAGPVAVCCGEAGSGGAGGVGVGWGGVVVVPGGGGGGSPGGGQQGRDGGRVGEVGVLAAVVGADVGGGAEPAGQTD